MNKTIFSVSSTQILNPGRRQVLQLAGAGALAMALPAYGRSNNGEANAPITTDTFSETIAWGRQAINDSLKGDTAAISVALFSGDKVVWQEGFGFASREDSVAATTATRFNTGSVGKVFAALVGAILHERGVINLDEPVVTYVRDFTMLSPDFKKITSRQLLSHSSGLPGTNELNLFAFKPFTGYAEGLKVAMADTHLKHAPGEMAIYCNDGFTLFERVVLAVTGQTFQDFMQKEVLDPLGMTQSAYALKPFPEGSFAHPYMDGKRLGQEFVNAYAAGGMVTTPGDMMKFARMLLDGGMAGGKRFMKEETIQMMAQNHAAGLKVNPSPEWRWGLGWDNVRQNGLAAADVLAWEKNGGTAFFSTEFFVLPKARIALALTGVSGEHYKPLDIAEGVLMRALHERNIIRDLPPQVSRTAPAAGTPSIDRSLAGIYANYKAPLKVEVMDDGAIDIRIWSAKGWQAKNPGVSRYNYRNDGWWWRDDGKLPCYRFTEATGADGATYRYLMMRIAGGAGYTYYTMPLGQQLAPLPKIPAAWQARLGTSWLLSSDDPSSVSMINREPAPLGELPDLPGYVMFNNQQLLIPLSDTRLGMSVKIPVNAGRDLTEIVVKSAGGAETLVLGSGVFTKV